MSTVHTVAQQGFGEGTNELYDRIRPSYQDWVLTHIFDNVRPKQPINIVEIGAGTGIFTRALLNSATWSTPGGQGYIGELRAVEPSAGMRTVFSQRIADPRVSIHEGAFDSTGIPDQWADLVIIAQAFHWCPDYEKAIEEFDRILKPKSHVAFVWNLEDRDSEARWAAQVRDLIEVYEQGTPQFRLGLWRQAFKTNAYKKAFAPPVETVVPFTIPATEDSVVDRMASKSYIAVLPPDTKKEVIQGLRGIVKRGDGLRWLDRERGVFEYPYRTTLVVSEKKYSSA